jgi:hypothetical protein
MPFIVYWYGRIDPSSAFSFLEAKNVKEYDVKLDNLPPKLQKKIDSGKGQLTKRQESLVRRFEEMRQDLAKKPEDRTKEEFKELHELDEWPMIMAGEYILI